MTISQPSSSGEKGEGVEEWRPVPGWETRYEVSSIGQVRKVTGGAVGLFLSDRGYLIARLSGPRAQKLAHRLVALAFIPPVPGKPDVNHIDNNRANNVVANLEWCTHAENLSHMARQGRRRGWPKGVRSPAAKLSDGTVRAIRTDRAAGASYSALAERHGTSKRTIGRILNGKDYRDA
jgi:hypothetical protein